MLLYSGEIGEPFLPVLQRPSSNIGRVGIYHFPFGACLRFTCVAACQVAAALWLTSFPKASAGRLLYPTVWVATGMNRQFPGRDLHPLVTCALVAHQYVVGGSKDGSQHYCRYPSENRPSSVSWIINGKPVLSGRAHLLLRIPSRR